MVDQIEEVVPPPPDGMDATEKPYTVVIPGREPTPIPRLWFSRRADTTSKLRSPQA